jgi:hypothetical protein
MKLLRSSLSRGDPNGTAITRREPRQLEGLVAALARLELAWLGLKIGPKMGELI